MGQRRTRLQQALDGLRAVAFHKRTLTMPLVALSDLPFGPSDDLPNPQRAEVA